MHCHCSIYNHQLLLELGLTLFPVAYFVCVYKGLFFGVVVEIRYYDMVNRPTCQNLGNISKIKRDF